MEQYLPYVQRLESLLQADRTPRPEWLASAERALDGEPSRELRRLVDLASRRADGAFFTGSKLAQRLVANAPAAVSKADLFFDPACGAGDLLLAGARRLPVIKSSLRKTLSAWGQRIAGMDKHPHFIRATRARLAILAISQGAKPDLDATEELLNLLPLLAVGDALIPSDLTKSVDWVLLNPPFQSMPVPSDCSWATGSITAAALFLAHVTNAAGKNTTISAILPDVLRSGSRYRAWREAITSQTEVQKLRRYGVFDTSADIDVFLLHLAKGEKRTGTPWLRCPASSPRNIKTVGDAFAVHVGPVVPHRHKEQGTESPFIHAKSLPRWEEFAPGVETRRSAGRLFMPPFLAIRRTSRTGDIKRAVATIITGTKPVAVENHLVVVAPNDGNLATCRALMRSLKSPKTDEWLNRRICCRHLTVGAVARIPLWGGEL